VRDLTFSEDRSRLRSGHAPQIMAAFRNLAITCFIATATSRSLPPDDIWLPAHTKPSTGCFPLRPHTSENSQALGCCCSHFFFALKEKNSIHLLARPVVTHGSLIFSGIK